MSSNLLLDSFGHYDVTATQMPTKWTSASGLIIPSVATGSTFGFRGFCSKTLGLYATVASGHKQFCGATSEILELSNQVNVDIRINFSIGSDGRIVATINGSPQTPSTFAITFGATYHFMVTSTFSYVLIDANTYNGTYGWTVYVNGVSRYSGSASTGNTHWDGNTANLAYSVISFATNDSAGGWMGDLWVTDGELLGQCPVYLFLATADGPVIDWTTSTGTSHFACVNTQVPTDVKYNSDAAAGNIDEYQMATVPAGTVKGLQVVVRMEKDASAAATLQVAYRNAAGTTVLGTPVYAPSLNSYAFFLDVNRKSVFTASDWTTAEINGGFFGVKRVT